MLFFELPPKLMSTPGAFSPARRAGICVYLVARTTLSRFCLVAIHSPRMCSLMPSW